MIYYNPAKRSYIETLEHDEVRIFKLFKKGTIALITFQSSIHLLKEVIDLDTLPVVSVFLVPLVWVHLKGWDDYRAIVIAEDVITRSTLLEG